MHNHELDVYARPAQHTFMTRKRDTAQNVLTCRDKLIAEVHTQITFPHQMVSTKAF